MASADHRGLRRCAGCGAMKPKSEMIRVIRTKDGEVLVDETQKKNGRGAYICRSSGCLIKAAKRKALSRDLKSNAGQSIYDRVREIIETLADDNE